MIWASGIVAPEGSVTDPVMVPLSLCPRRIVDKNRNSQMLRFNKILPPQERTHLARTSTQTSGPLSPWTSVRLRTGPTERLLPLPACYKGICRSLLLLRRNVAVRYLAGTGVSSISTIWSAFTPFSVCTLPSGQRISRTETPVSAPSPKRTRGSLNTHTQRWSGHGCRVPARPPASP